MSDAHLPTGPQEDSVGFADRDDLPLHAGVAVGIQPMQPPLRRAAELQARLRERIHLSAEAHREYATIRREDGEWLPAATDGQRRVLRSDACVRVEIVQLATGAALPWPDDAQAQEVLLLSGALAAEDGGEVSPAGLPGAVAYCVRRRERALGGALTATQPTTVYVRYLLCGLDQLPALEARWWELACAAPAWVDPGRKRWHASSNGVDVLPLRGDGDVVSMLVRFAAGASVPDHGHALDEDCLVLTGEMFLGDILLRTGDYQLAPAGGSHFGETSDVGVLFFFHGAVDPVLRGEPPTAR